MYKPQPKRNPVTYKKHRREVFWQITFPVIIGIVLISGLAAWTVATAAQGGSVSQSADASLIFLLVSTMVIAIIPLAILAGLAYAVIWLNKNIPPYAHQAQDAMIRLREGVRTGTDKLVEPILRFKSALASLEAFKRK